jgi:fumarate reductase flavoprotein subunit
MGGFEFTVPVLIAGGGACGAIAALAARDAGAAPLLVEADARPMGSTGMSQGLIAAAGTRAQAAAGIDDSGEQFLADIMAKSRGTADPAVARALAFGSGPVLDWMAEAHDLPWQLDRGFAPSYGNSVHRIHGWPGHGGQDMVDLLHARLADRDIDVLLSARLTEVIADAGGTVRGVLLERPDGSVERIGCGALVLASGGFAANRALVAAHIPDMAVARNNGHEGSQGIAIAVGRQLGAGFGDMGSYQGYGMLTEPHGITVPPPVIIDGGVLINCAGARFTDESADIAGVVHPVMAQAGGYVWVVFDQRIEQRTGYIPEMQAFAGLKAARCGDSTEELATAIGVPAAALSAALAEAAQARSEGRRDATGREWHTAEPPTGSLRALKVVGAIYHTQGGMQVDGAARVLRADATALPNLFAAGGAARSVSGPSFWGYLPAIGLTTAVTLGRLAGTAAARLALHPTGG